MNNKQKMSKRNMKIFPIYKKIGWDFLFFYTIEFIFLTQVKNISASGVVLKSTAYAFFSIIMQIPANIIIEFLGRKNSIILGNVFNCIYMVIVIASRNLYDLIFAELVEAFAFSIKNIAEPSLLNESIPPSRYKSDIYARISGRGAAGYYTLNAISKIIAGYMFTINTYLPIIFSLIVLIITTILSIVFIEPIKKEKKNINDVAGKNQLKDIKSGFAFVLKSERLKSLILCASLITALLAILGNYYVSLFEDFEISSFYIGIIAALRKFYGIISIKKAKRNSR